MNKHMFTWHGKKYFLLGQDHEGIKYYLENAHFDCNWYWGIGYIESFSNNRNPAISRDIRSHEHFDSKVFGKNKCCFDVFKELFPVNPFTDKEIWNICELMKSAYTARHYSDMLHTGGAHITTNKAKDKIRNDKEYKRINEITIPGILDELYSIMGEGETA